MDKNESKCGYSSINDCQNDSKNKGGMCIPSQVFSNDSKYCLVTNLGRNCVYNNFETCQKSAESINGSCQLK